MLNPLALNTLPPMPNPGLTSLAAAHVPPLVPPPFTIAQPGRALTSDTAALLARHQADVDRVKRAASDLRNCYAIVKEADGDRVISIDCVPPVKQGYRCFNW